MVSSANLSPCSAMSPRRKQRVLNVDFNKDFSTPLQVETSVEYDLPSHIYPPKGSAPILMIHPNPSQYLRTMKPSNETIAVPRPLSSLQIHSNSVPNSYRSVSKPRVSCSCGNSSCNSVGTSRPNVINNSWTSAQQPQNVSSRYVSQIPENVYSSVKSAHLPLNVEVKPSKKYTPKSQFQKQFELHQHLQQAQMQRHLSYEKVKIQAQQQQQQQYHHMHSQPHIISNNCPQQPHNTEQMAWNLSVPQPGSFICCQPKVAGNIPPTAKQSEFLQPGIPPSLLARTPSRGPSGGSPKLRARSRRGLSVANTVHHPEYLGSAARSSRTANACISSHARTRSASMLVSTQSSQPSALDVVRVLTPRTIFANNQQLQTVPTSSLLSTIVGQSRDSGCSLSAETLTPIMTSNETNVDWTPWGVVDSGFCTPVDIVEDQIMEPLNTSNPFITTSSLVNSLANHKKSSFGTLNWMKSFPAPITSTLPNPFVPQTNHPHYIPQTIWNLAY